MQNHAFCAVRSVADIFRTGAEHRLKNAHGGGCGLDVGKLGDVVGPFGLEFFAGEPFAGRARKRGPGETVGDDGVRAELADAAEDVVVEAVDDSGDGDYCGDADDDAENGECRAQRVLAQRIESEQDLVAEFERSLLAAQQAQGQHRCMRVRQCFSERGHCL